MSKVNPKKRRFPTIPRKDAMPILHKKIKDLYKIGYSYDEISDMMDVSKTTISFAVKGRAKDK